MLVRWIGIYMLVPLTDGWGSVLLHVFDSRYLVVSCITSYDSPFCMVRIRYRKGHVLFKYLLRITSYISIKCNKRGCDFLEEIFVDSEQLYIDRFYRGIHKKGKTATFRVPLKEFPKLLIELWGVSCSELSTTLYSWGCLWCSPQTIVISFRLLARPENPVEDS